MPKTKNKQGVLFDTLYTVLHSSVVKFDCSDWCDYKVIVINVTLTAVEPFFGI